MNHILRLCVKSFSHLGENEIKCWNEENSDIYEHEAIRFLVEKKDWAFVSDYVRLKVLYEHGGIYFDTDSNDGVLIGSIAQSLAEHSLILRGINDEGIGWCHHDIGCRMRCG